jgi:RNA polymerase sigma factor (sigma-70 family)
MDRDELHNLLGQARAGDHAAATALLREFEPALRREARLMLDDEQLRPVVDTSDIVQSACALFFLRLRAGQFDLEHPGQVANLLAQIARNRVRSHRQKHRAGKRDRRLVEGEGALAGAVDPGSDPASVVERRDLLERLLDRLAPDARAIAELRAAGQAWAEIAAGRGMSPDAVRKQYERAIDRALEAMGLQEPADA